MIGIWTSSCVFYLKKLNTYSFQFNLDLSASVSDADLEDGVGFGGWVADAQE